MPGWYIHHLVSDKKSVDRLRAGNVASNFPGGIANVHVKNYSIISSQKVPFWQ